MIPIERTRLSFWQKFRELQMKMFWQGETVQNHMYSSEPIEWPLMSKGIAYWYQKDTNVSDWIIDGVPNRALRRDQFGSEFVGVFSSWHYEFLMILILRLKVSKVRTKLNVHKMRITWSSNWGYLFWIMSTSSRLEKGWKLGRSEMAGQVGTFLFSMIFLRKHSKKWKWYFSLIWGHFVVIN